MQRAKSELSEGRRRRRDPTVSEVPKPIILPRNPMMVAADPLTPTRRRRQLPSSQWPDGDRRRFAESSSSPRGRYWSVGRDMSLDNLPGVPPRRRRRHFTMRWVAPLVAALVAAAVTATHAAEHVVRPSPETTHFGGCAQPHTLSIPFPNGCRCPLSAALPFTRYPTLRLHTSEVRTLRILLPDLARGSTQPLSSSHPPTFPRRDVHMFSFLFTFIEPHGFTWRASPLRH
jgi:hypothetical protein